MAFWQMAQKFTKYRLWEAVVTQYDSNGYKKLVFFWEKQDFPCNFGRSMLYNIYNVVLIIQL